MVQQQLDKRKNGFISLFTVLLLIAVAGVISTTLLVLSIDSFKTNNSIETNIQAKMDNDSCMEFAIETLRNNNNYVGNEIISVNQSSCEIRPIQTSGTNYIIEVESILEDITIRARASLAEIVPNLLITSWINVNTF